MIAEGAAVLAPEPASLVRGLVIGDDSAQPPEMIARFRASGLSHLTAVSGQNVALTVACAGPLLRRWRPLGRWVATVGLIGWFVVVTRAEPSVLRAGAMAALGATAFALGRPRAPARLLPAAVIGLVLLDPLLVWSVGFWLSSGATAGVVVIGPWLAARLWRLGPLALPIGITLGAQLGVALPSLLVFGRLSLVGTVANLLAVPVAGFVMFVGLPACLVAAVAPGRRRDRDGADRARRPVDRRRGHRRRRTGAVRSGARDRLDRAGRWGRGARSRWVVRRRRCQTRRRHDRASRMPMTVHVLVGDDESLLRAATSELVHRLVGDGDRSLMVEEFDGDEYDLARVVDAAQTMPFLTDRRVVVARGAGRFTKDELEPLIGYLAEPMPTTALVLTVSAGKLAKPLADAAKLGGAEIITTAAPSRPRDRTGWVAEQAGEAGVKLSGPAVALVAERLGEEAGRLDGILATLSATYGRGTTLTPVDVEPFIGEGGGVPPWDLTDAIDAGDTAKALKLLGRMTSGRPSSAAAHGHPDHPLRQARPARRGRCHQRGAGGRGARASSPASRPARRWISTDGSGGANVARAIASARRGRSRPSRRHQRRRGHRDGDPRRPAQPAPPLTSPPTSIAAPDAQHPGRGPGVESAGTDRDRSSGSAGGGVDLGHQARLASSGLVGVDDALGGRLVEALDRGLDVVVLRLRADRTGRRS